MIEGVMVPAKEPNVESLLPLAYVYDRDEKGNDFLGLTSLQAIYDKVWNKKL